MFLQGLTICSIVFGIYTVLRIIVSKRKRGETLKKALLISLFLVGIFVLLWSFYMLEYEFFKFFNNSIIVLIFEIELLALLLSIPVFYYLFKNETRPPYAIYIVGIVSVLFLHIVLAGIMRDFIRGSITACVVSIIILFSHDYIRGKSKSLKNSFLARLKGSNVFGKTNFSEHVSPDSSEYLNLGINNSIQNEWSSNKNIDSKGEQNQKIKFWHGVVELTQCPVLEQNNSFLAKKSWLINFFHNNRSYGVRLRIHNGLRWEFFVKVRSKSEAKRSGQAILSALKHLFQGFDGIVKTKPITSANLYQKRVFYEILLPKPPYMEPISFIEKVINIFDQTTQEVEIFILWKSAHPYYREKIRKKVNKLIYEDSETKREIYDMWRKEAFKLRIFISSQIHSKDSSEIEGQIAELKGVLRTLTMGAKNYKDEAFFKRTSAGAWIDILKTNLYKGRLVTPKVIDFEFPEKIPLLKAPILETENIKNRTISKNDKNFVALGEQFRSGVKTKRIGFVHIDAFTMSCFVSGLSGVGKTRLIDYLLDQICKKRSDVGILGIGIGKENQQQHYKGFKVLKYGDPELKIPYYVKGPHLEQSQQEYASIYTASLGLKNVVDVIVLNIIQQYEDQFGNPPESPKAFWNGFDIFVKNHPYHLEFQTNLRRAIKNRVMPLFSSEMFHDIVKYTGDIPQWFVEWQNGENYLLDLSMCNKYQKILLAMLVLQMIRTLTPKTNAGKLKNLVVFDEAHNLTSKPITINPDDFNFISQEQLELIFHKLVNEFREMGVGFLFADQHPSSLFPSIVDVSLRISFRVGMPCNMLFTENFNDRALLTNLPDRVALVQNRAESETYLIKTLDYEPPKTVNNIKAYTKIKTDKTQNLKLNDRLQPILRGIIRDPNFLRLNYDFLENNLIISLSKKLNELEQKGMFKEAYCVLYALMYYKLSTEVEISIPLKFDLFLDAFQYVRMACNFLEKNEIELDYNIYNEFINVGFLHSGFLRNAKGIENEYPHAKKAFRGIYNEICDKLRIYINEAKSIKTIFSG